MEKWIKKHHTEPAQKPATDSPGLNTCSDGHQSASCKVCSIPQQLLPTWSKALSNEFSKEYFSNILTRLHTSPFYPPPESVLRALSYFEVHDTKVVILGQDPYHGLNQAMGLSFSVNHGITVPPSLRNIYKEIDSTIGYSQGIPKHGSLVKWAEQGVLLLNTTLTVSPSSPGSHYPLGWYNFTDAVIQAVCENSTGTVFMLWGADAAKKKALVDCNKHLILACPHPSPFSANRGFFGCDHFRKANSYLLEQNKTPIDWTCENV